MSLIFNPLSGTFDYVGSGSTNVGIGTPILGSTPHSILSTDGVSALSEIGPLTDGQLIIGSTGAAAAAASLTGTTAKINITNGPGSIVVNTPLGDLLNPQELYVDSAGGNDTTGTGSIVMPFDSIEKALTLTTDTSKVYVIFLSPGDYGVAPLTIPSNVNIYGKGANITQPVTIDFIPAIQSAPVYQGLSASVTMDMSPASVAIASFSDGSFDVTRTDSTGGAHYFTIHTSTITGLDLTGTCLITNCNFVSNASVQNSANAVLNSTVIGINIDLTGTGSISMVGCTFSGTITGIIDAGNTPTVYSDASSLGYGGTITVATVIDLDSSSYVSYSPTTPADWATTPTNVEEGLDYLAADKINLSEKGSNNGVATLDAGGKIPAAQLPNSVMDYRGTWDASTNTPTLADGVGDTGDVYVVSVAGDQDLGSGVISFAVGDFAIYNGSIWEKSLNSNAVVSVNGQTGIVTVANTALSNLTTTSINQHLIPSGTRDLGTPSNRWRRLYISADIHNGTFPVLDVASRTLVNSTGNISIDFDSADIDFANNSMKSVGEIRDAADIPAVSIEIRTLFDTAGNAVMNFQNTDIDILTRKIVNVVDPTDPQDVATKNYVDTAVGAVDLTPFVRHDGTVIMTGNLDFDTGYTAINLVTPTNPGDAATKGYVDGEIDLISISGDIPHSSFAAANNQAVPTSVVGLAFAVGVTRSFEALVSVSLDATTPAYEAFKIIGINIGGVFSIQTSSVGDVSGVSFNITAGGQIQYTSSNAAGFVSLKIGYRAITTQV